MSTITISVIVFVCLFGGALLGVFLRGVLPEEHLSAASRDLVKMGIGTIATPLTPDPRIEYSRRCRTNALADVSTGTSLGVQAAPCSRNLLIHHCLH